MSLHTQGCSEFEQELGSYLDGELASAERAALESHLPGCPACREAIEAQRWLAAELRTLPPIEASPDFASRFWDRIDGEDARATRERPPARRSWLERLMPTPRLEWALVTAALALFALWLSPGPQSALPSEDWAIVADADEFELLAHEDWELLATLDVLEQWDGSEGG